MFPNFEAGMLAHHSFLCTFHKNQKPSSAFSTYKLTHPDIKSGEC